VSLLYHRPVRSSVGMRHNLAVSLGLLPAVTLVKLFPESPGVRRHVFMGACILLAGSLTSGAQSPSDSSVDCSIPSQALNPACQSYRQGSGSSGTVTTPSQVGEQDLDGSTNSSGSARGVYVDSAGSSTSPRTGNGKKADSAFRPGQAMEPQTDFQRLVKNSTNESLPLFGRELFRLAPSTFAPADQVPVSQDYVVGPGDEIVLRVWGHNTFNGRLTVDRTGSIYVPQVGSIHVASLRYAELQQHIHDDLSRTFRNFEMSVNLGQLRSIQVFVLGQAKQPGSYTVSSLSTVFNALLVSGGPTSAGSVRDIRVQRGNQTVGSVDLYDFALRGDKSKDITLRDGDVVFIPVVGPQVAVSGSVRRPAIFEVKESTTVAEVLELAGGLSSTASGGRFSLERIESHHERQSISLKLDDAGNHMKVADGDVLHVDSMLAAYKDSVTIRGNLANAGRFPWTPGMKVSDIIPDRDALLTNDYWVRRNLLGIPTPLFQPLHQDSSDHNRSRGVRPNEYGQPNTSYGSESGSDGQSRSNGLTASDELAASGGLAASDEVEQARSGELRNRRRNDLQDASEEVNRSSLADQQFNANRDATGSLPRNEIKVPGPAIDWSYAVVERLDPVTLRTSLIPFNLGQLVMEHAASQDVPLQPGDVVTILSQSDLQVSQDERPKYIRLEGEFASSGVYSVGPNETLADVVRKAGGFTNKAYLFGASFSRETARVMQQQRLDEYVSSLSIQLERASAVRAVSASTAGAGGNLNLTNDEALIKQLRAMRATGRIVLEFKPLSAGAASVPAVQLEDGDTFRVPSRPLVVSVVGSVYGPNVYLYNGSRRVGDYLKLAGRPTRIADSAHAFIIRADGSIVSRNPAKGFWSDNFYNVAVYPGDTIVIPEKPVRPTFLRDVIDYSQVFSQFALGAAAINVIK
jgi:protein involved in polysaccharide export with SLBB domain